MKAILWQTCRENLYLEVWTLMKRLRKDWGISGCIAAWAYFDKILLLRLEDWSQEVKTCSLAIRWDIHLRSCVAIGAVRRAAVQSVTATIVVGFEWNSIATVDWLSIRLSLGSDGKHHSLWAGGPFWGGHDSTWASVPVAVTCITVEPILRVASRSVGRAQSDSVSTVNGGISVNFQSKRRIMCSYFKSRVHNSDGVQQWWQNRLTSLLVFAFSFPFSRLSQLPGYN